MSEETASVISFEERAEAKRRKLHPHGFAFSMQERTVTFVGEQIEEDGEPAYRICVSVTVASGDTDGVVNCFKERGVIGITWPCEEILLFDVDGLLGKV